MRMVLLYHSHTKKVCEPFFHVKFLLLAKFYLGFAYQKVCEPFFHEKILQLLPSFQ
jgi:hypothetical protein